MENFQRQEETIMFLRDGTLRKKAELKLQVIRLLRSVKTSVYMHSGVWAVILSMI